MNIFIAQALSTDVVNTTLNSSMSKIVAGFGQTQNIAIRILAAMVGIEIAWTIINGMLKRDAQGLLEQCIKKSFVCALFMLLTFNWGQVTGAIRGYIAGSGGASVSQTLNPSAMAENGVKKVAIIFNPEAHETVIHSFMGKQVKAKKRELNERAKARDAKADGVVDKVGNKVQSSIEEMTLALETGVLTVVCLLMFMLIGLAVIVAQFYASVQTALITLEFYIIVSITVKLIPFGVNKHTSYLATGAINAVIASSVKLAVLFSIVSLLGSAASQTLLPQQADMYALLSLFLQTLLFVFAISKVNQIASTVFNGAGSGIDVGTVATQMAAATSAAMMGGSDMAMQKATDMGGADAFGEAVSERFKAFNDNGAD